MSIFPSGRHLATACTAFLAVALLAGCSASQATSGESASAQFPKNRDTWALPLDAYAFDMTPASLAEELLMVPCMKEAGFDFPKPHVNLDAPGPENVSPRGEFFLSVKSAKKWGYLEGPSKRVNPVQMKRDHLAFFKKAGAAGEKANEACLTKVRSQLDKHGNQSALQKAVGYAGESDFYKDPAVVAAAKKWHECMKPKGIAELPQDPEHMVDLFLPVSDGEGGSELSLNRDDIVYTGKVPEKERQIAAMDAECQESSGYLDALYSAQYEGELKAYVKHQDELERLKVQIDKYQVAMRQIIDQSS